MSSQDYVIDKEKGIYHSLDCQRVKDIVSENKTHTTSALDAFTKGNKPCNICKPALPDFSCPNCGAPAILRESRLGDKFYGCSKYPLDRYMLSWESAAEKLFFRELEIIGLPEIQHTLKTKEAPQRAKKYIRGNRIGNEKTRIFHNPHCFQARLIRGHKAVWFESAIEALIDGYEPCKICKPMMLNYHVMDYISPNPVQTYQPINGKDSKEIILSPNDNDGKASSFFEEKPNFIPAVVTAIMLLLAVAPLQYDYYTILRWVVTIAGIYLSSIGALWRASGFWWMVFVFPCVAILFNPINPIHLTKAIWVPIDILCSILFIYSAIKVKKPPTEDYSVLDVFGGLFGMAWATALGATGLILLWELVKFIWHRIPGI
jgi:predicted RNA-binding Zn-ribbon protein involved in translation (DUF1610 family)